MTFSLDKVVPWGRSFDEYVAMFSLSKSDLAGSILGCGDGPASFNSIQTKHGGKVISVDPLYRFSADEIKNRINETYHEIIEQTRKNKKEFVWNNIRSVEELGRIRMKAMEEFLSDYEAGREEEPFPRSAEFDFLVHQLSQKHVDLAQELSFGHEVSILHGQLQSVTQSAHAARHDGDLLDRIGST